MSQSIIRRYLAAHRFVEGSRAYSSTYGPCVIVAFTSDGWATVAPSRGACPFGDVSLRDLAGGEG